MSVIPTHSVDPARPATSARAVPSPRAARTVVHVVDDDPTVRAALASACPHEVDVHTVPDPDRLVGRDPGAPSAIVLDPTSTPPADVRTACAGWAHPPVLVGVSGLVLPAAEADRLGLDAAVPRRRADGGALRGVLALLGLPGVGGDR